MRELWPHSYRLIGAVAYKGVVPPEAIVRYATIDPFYAWQIMRWGANAEMNLMIHYLFGAFRCGALTDLVLDGTTLPAFDLSPELSVATVQELREIIWTSEADQLAAEAERQKGVRVYTPRRVRGRAFAATVRVART